MDAQADNRRTNLPNLDPRLAEEESRPAAVRHLLERLLADAWACEPGILAGTDDEFLHRYRVNLRRARVLVVQARDLLGLRAARSLNCHLRALVKHTGPLRDLDVQLADRVGMNALPPAERAILEGGFLAHLDQRRAREQRAFRRYLRSLEHQHRRQRLREILAEPPVVGSFPALREFLAERIRQRFRKLAKRTDGTDLPDDGELHRCRIEAKKLRYLLEFGQGLLPVRRTARCIRDLKRVQDALGQAHDLLVRLGWVRGYAAPLRDPAERTALAHLEHLVAEELDTARDSAAARLREFRETCEETNPANL
jgi:CHAD domain-containing protein